MQLKDYDNYLEARVLVYLSSNTAIAMVASFYWTNSRGYGIEYEQDCLYYRGHNNKRDSAVCCYIGSIIDLR